MTISLDEFCNFYIFTYDGVVGEAKHGHGVGRCHSPWPVSSSVGKGSSALRCEARNTDSDWALGVRSRAMSLCLGNRYPEAVVGGDVGVLASVLHVGKLQAFR